MKRSRLSVVLSAGVLVTLSSLLSPTAFTQAAVVGGGKGPQLLIGEDDDNITNVKIQADATADQALSRTDIIDGGTGNDLTLASPVFLDVSQDEVEILNPLVGAKVR